MPSLPRETAPARKCWRRRSISDMELFIAVTDLDEVNLIACLLAHDHGVPRIIARIKSLEYSKAEWNRNAARLGIG